MTALSVRELTVEYPARIAVRRRRGADVARTALLRLPRLPDRPTDGDAAPVRALDAVTLDIARGERVAIVGESGSGKSTLGNAIGRLLPTTARYVSGTIQVGDADVLSLDRTSLRAVRREQLGFIPQDPIASLDPTMRVGAQCALVAGAVGAPRHRAALVDMLDAVQISDPARVLHAYPHELSGGMAQRVAIAIAIVRRPRVLIADEPTAALDANVRRDVLQLIFDVAEEHDTAILWISHDLGSVAGRCDRVAVMHHGRIVEDGDAQAVLSTPKDPYTQHLLESMPSRLLAEREEPR